MPSSPRSPNNRAVTDDLPKLTDGDVKLLYLIVKESERLQNAGAYPLGALFGAYEEVIRDLRLDPLETFYFRFLLKFGEVQRPETLFGKFETLLAERGISLELDQGDVDLDQLRHELRSSLHQEDHHGQNTYGDHSASSPKAIRRASFGSFGDTIHDPSLHISDNRPRRASFSSFYDAGDEATQRYDLQPPRRKPRRMQSSGAEDVASSESRYPDHEVEPPLSSSELDSGSRIASNQVGQEPPRIQRRRRFGSDNDRRRTQPHELPLGKPDEREDGPLVRSNHARPLAEIGRPVQSLDEARNGLPTTLASQPSSSEMALQAEGFYHYCISSSFLKRWKAADSFYQKLGLIAIKYDRRILLHQALETWRLHLHKKRQLAETERFFAHLGRRAKKARNLYLLTKAFTHWVRLTDEEVHRTSVARRHILRTKYFGAWRAISAVDELKARRFRLAKIFVHWKNLSVGTLAQQENADTVYKSSLTRRTYWGWLWSFFERRAPGWYEWTSKRKHLIRWFAHLQERSDREAWAEATSKQKILQKYLRRWTNGGHVVVEREQQASVYRKKMLQRKLFGVWRKQSRLNPLFVRLSRSIDTRIARNTISFWKKQAEAEKHAAWVNRLRILRNTWTSWNDRLRSQSLAARIDDRVVLVALYKWVLAERYILYRRLVDSRLKQRTLYTLVGRWRDRQDRYWEGEYSVRNSQVKRTLQSVLGHWHSRLKDLKDRAQSASEFHTRCLTLRYFPVWRGLTAQVQQGYQTATDARYFFLANRTIQVWKNALAVSRRRRIQAAYATVRRKNKISLARRALQSWKQHTADVAGMRQEANRLYHDRLLSTGKKVAEHWRIQSEQMIRMSDYATTVENQTVFRNSQRSWKDRLKLMQELDEAASYLAERILLQRTAALLSKLRTLAWRYCQRIRLAVNFWERNENQQVRNLLKNWNTRAKYGEVADNFRRGIYFRTWIAKARHAREKREAEKRTEETAQSTAISRLGTSLQSPLSTQTTNEVDGFLDPDYTPRRSEDLFAIDGHPDDLISNLGESIGATPTPMLGPPSTPSRRPARAPGLRRPLLTPRTPHPSLFARPQKSTGRKSFADSLWTR